MKLGLSLAIISEHYFSIKNWIKKLINNYIFLQFLLWFHYYFLNILVRFCSRIQSWTILKSICYWISPPRSFVSKAIFLVPQCEVVRDWGSDFPQIERCDLSMQFMKVISFGLRFVSYWSQAGGQQSECTRNEKLLVYRNWISYLNVGRHVVWNYALVGLFD